MDTYEFVASGGYVEIRLLLINKERIWHPYVLNELGTN